MSYGDFIGVFTTLLIICFLGICFWAWSRSNKETFSSMAELPLNDQPNTPQTSSSKDVENHHE